MPILCEMQMNATVVFFNMIEEADSLGHLLEECFESGKEYAFYKAEESGRLISGGSIMEELETRSDKKLLNVSQQQKFVFAFYLKMADASRERVGQIHRLMEDFSEKLHPGNASHIVYLICYRQDWKSTSALTKEELKASVHTSVRNTTHAEYIIYKSAFRSCQMQENALVRYLHMLSRDNSSMGIPFIKEQEYLYAFSFDCFDEEVTENSRKRIQRYNTWLQEEKDAGCSSLCQKIVEHARDMVDGYWDMLSDFAYWQPLFPRKEGDYKRVWILWHRLEYESASHIEKARKECIQRYLETLEQRVEWEKWHEWICANITYRDFKNLKSETALNKFMEGVALELRREWTQLMGEKALEEAILGVYRRKIMEMLGRWEEQRRKVEELLSVEQENMASNGKYSDMRECLRNITGNISFQLPPVLTRQGRKDWLLVRDALPGDMAELGSIGGYAEDKDIYLYPCLYPWKIQLLSIAMYDPSDKSIGQLLGRKDENDEG